jgi:hypothetical protein
MAAVESFTFTRRIVLRLRIRLGISLAASPLCVDFARFTSERYPRADVRGIASLALLDAVSVTPAVGLPRELLGLLRWISLDAVSMVSSVIEIRSTWTNDLATIGERATPLTVKLEQAAT